MNSWAIDVKHVDYGNICFCSVFVFDIDVRIFLSPYLYLMFHPIVKVTCTSCTIRSNCFCGPLFRTMPTNSESVRINFINLTHQFTHYININSTFRGWWCLMPVHSRRCRLDWQSQRRIRSVTRARAREVLNLCWERKFCNSFRH